MPLPHSDHELAQSFNWSIEVMSAQIGVKPLAFNSERFTRSICETCMPLRPWRPCSIAVFGPVSYKRVYRTDLAEMIPSYFIRDVRFRMTPGLIYIRGLCRPMCRRAYPYPLSYMCCYSMCGLLHACICWSTGVTDVICLFRSVLCGLACGFPALAASCCAWTGSATVL